MPRLSRHDRLSLLALIAALALVVAFPGDARFAADEAGFMSKALAANERGQLEKLGPVGSFGNTYGPLPIHVDQLLLLATRDLRVMVAIHAFVVAAGSAAALWVLGGALGLRRWFIPIVIAAPWVWYYSRIIWGNPLWLVTSCALLAGYALWQRRPTGLRAAEWTAAAALMPAIHPSALALPAAVWIHAILFRRALLHKTWIWAIVGTVVALAPSGPYLGFLARDFYQRFSRPPAPVALVPGTTRPIDWFAKSTRAGRIESATFALRGAVLLSGEQRFYIPPRQTAMANWLNALRPISRFAHLWLLVGVCVAAIELWRADRAPSQPDGDRGVARRGLLAVALLAIGLQAILFAAIRINWHEHYLAATFAPTVVLCWIGFDRLLAGRWLRWLAIAPAAAAAVCTLSVAIAIHRTHGAGSDFSPNVANLIWLARELRSTDDSEAWTSSTQLEFCPQALTTVRRMMSHEPSDQDPGAGPEDRYLLIHSRRSDDGWLIVERADSVPPGFRRIPLQPAKP